MMVQITSIVIEHTGSQNDILGGKFTSHYIYSEVWIFPQNRKAFGLLCKYEAFSIRVRPLHSERKWFMIARLQLQDDMRALCAWRTKDAILSLSCLQDEDIDLKAMCMNVKVNDRNVKMNIILAYGVLSILACSCARMVVSMNKFISTCPLRFLY